MASTSKSNNNKSLNDNISMFTVKKELKKVEWAEVENISNAQKYFKFKCILLEMMKNVIV